MTAHADPTPATGPTLADLSDNIDTWVSRLAHPSVRAHVTRTIEAAGTADLTEYRDTVAALLAGLDTGARIALLAGATPDRTAALIGAMSAS